jgi:hypothetical protein
MIIDQIINDYLDATKGLPDHIHQGLGSVVSASIQASALAQQPHIVPVNNVQAYLVYVNGDPDSEPVDLFEGPYPVVAHLTQLDPPLATTIKYTETYWLVLTPTPEDSRWIPDSEIAFTREAAIWMAYKLIRTALKDSLKEAQRKQQIAVAAQDFKAAATHRDEVTLIQEEIAETHRKQASINITPGKE